MVGPRSLHAVLALALASACSGDSPSSGPIDAPIDSDVVPLDAPSDAPSDGGSIDGTPPPPGFFVVDKLIIPSSANQATVLGLDIDDRPNDGIDNQLGVFLASLGALAPALAFQPAMDQQIDRGQILLLATLPIVLADVPLTFYPGANPQPPACASAADTACRRHLTGTGQLDVAAGAPTDSVIPGSIISFHFFGGPGQMVLPLALSPTRHVELVLHQARAELNVSTMSFSAGSKIGGAISDQDIDAVFTPGFHATAVERIDADCPLPRSPPTCSCAPSSAGGSLLSFLDSNDDCTLTVGEVRTSINGLLARDIDLDGDGANDAVSVGVGIHAVTASFTAPAQ